MTATDTKTGRRHAAHTTATQDPETPPCTDRRPGPVTIIPDPDAAGIVRRQRCSRCGAPAGTACQTQPSADHARRWLDAYTAGLISRDDVAEQIAALVVLTDWALIPATAAERAA